MALALVKPFMLNKRLMYMYMYTYMYICLRGYYWYYYPNFKDEAMRLREESRFAQSCRMSKGSRT